MTIAQPKRWDVDSPYLYKVYSRLKNKKGEVLDWDVYKRQPLYRAEHYGREVTRDNYRLNFFMDVKPFKGFNYRLNTSVDNFDKHIEDTMIAGDWISNRAAVEKVVREAPAQIEELIKWGVDFDKNEKGEFDLHREGGHSEFRILHHKDNTGDVYKRQPSYFA